MVGANGFEPSTSWSRTGESNNLKPCGCRTYKPHHPKNPASIGPQSPQRKGGFYDGGNLPFRQGIRLESIIRVRGPCVPLENLEMSERMGVIFPPISSIILADAHFSQDNPHNSVFDLPFAGCSQAREPGSAPPNRRASEVRKKTPESAPTPRAGLQPLPKSQRSRRPRLRFGYSLAATS